MSPGSPGLSRFLLSPGRASAASNIVKPEENNQSSFKSFTKAVVLKNDQLRN